MYLEELIVDFVCQRLFNLVGLYRCLNCFATEIMIEHCTILHDIEMLII